MRLGDLDALKETKYVYHDNGEVGERLYISFDEIDNAPTVDAVPVKHGQWEEKTVGSYEENAVIAQWQSARCSECGRYLTTPYLYYFTKYNFCPECGAKMDGERRESDG